jgi:hypothetical protein
MAPDNRERPRWRDWEHKRRPRRGGGQDRAARRAGAVRHQQRTRGQQRGGGRPSGGAALLALSAREGQDGCGVLGQLGFASGSWLQGTSGRCCSASRARRRGRGRGVESLGGCAGAAEAGHAGGARRGSWARGSVGPPMRARAGALGFGRRGRGGAMHWQGASCAERLDSGGRQSSPRWLELLGEGERRPRRRQVAGFGDEEAAPEDGRGAARCVAGEGTGGERATGWAAGVGGAREGDGGWKKN